MKVTVDDNCTACGLCVDMCPEVFQFGDDGFAHPVVDVVPSEHEDTVREAAESCPVEAIHIEQ